MIRILPLLVAALTLTACAGGPDHREIKQISTDLFDAMERRDVDLASRLLIHEGTISSVRADGTDDTITLGTWLDSLSEGDAVLHEEFTGNPVIMVEGDVAMLWGEYKFWIDGEPSHTGIDVFTFVRTDDGWKLAGGVYSVIPIE